MKQDPRVYDCERMAENQWHMAQVGSHMEMMQSETQM